MNEYTYSQTDLNIPGPADLILQKHVLLSSILIKFHAIPFRLSVPLCHFFFCPDFSCLFPSNIFVGLVNCCCHAPVRYYRLY